MFRDGAKRRVDTASRLNARAQDAGSQHAHAMAALRQPPGERKLRWDIAATIPENEEKRTGPLLRCFIHHALLRFRIAPFEQGGYHLRNHALDLRAVESSVAP